MPVAVKDILPKKTQKVASVTQDSTVLEAAKLMNQHRIGAVVVTKGPTVVGIFTERDILTRVVASKVEVASTRVSEVMTTPVACCRSDTPLSECQAVMTSKRIRHLPVVDNNCLVGLVSIGDLMAHQLSTDQQTIHYLQEYLYGPCPPTE